MNSINKNCLLELPEDTIKAVRKIHGLDKPGRLEEAINILQEWTQKQDHILKKDFSKTFLEIMLTSCKGSVEKAKKRIDSLCTMKTLLPKFFNKTNVRLELQNATKYACPVPLPRVTNDYYRVVLVKWHKNIIPDIFMQHYQYCIILSEYIKMNDYANGFIFVEDLSEVNLLDLFTKLDTVEIQQFQSILIEGYVARIKGIHVITDSKAVDLIIKLCKQVLSEKIGKRVHIHPTVEDLHKMIPKEILPMEYGGHERSIEKLRMEWIETLSAEDHVQHMKMMNKACTDETKRHSAKFNEEILGMPGSFRNLSVD